MEVKSDELSLSMVVPEAEKIPELVALPVEGDQQGMLQAAMGTIPSPCGSLWPCRTLAPSSQSPLAVTLCPQGHCPCPHHAQAGAAGTKGLVPAHGGCSWHGKLSPAHGWNRRHRHSHAALPHTGSMAGSRRAKSFLGHSRLQQQWE